MHRRYQCTDHDGWSLSSPLAQVSTPFNASFHLSSSSSGTMHTASRIYPPESDRTFMLHDQHDHGRISSGREYSRETEEEIGSVPNSNNSFPSSYYPRFHGYHRIEEENVENKTRYRPDSLSCSISKQEEVRRKSSSSRISSRLEGYYDPYIMQTELDQRRENEQMYYQYQYQDRDLCPEYVEKHRPTHILGSITKGDSIPSRYQADTYLNDDPPRGFFSSTVGLRPPYSSHQYSSILEEEEEKLEDRTKKLLKRTMQQDTSNPHASHGSLTMSSRIATSSLRMGILPYHLLQNKEFLSDRIMKHREEKKEEAQRVDPIVREVTLFEPSQGSSTTGTIVKISPPPPPPPQAATAAVAVATVAFKPKKKRLRIKTERRREQCRRNQERYRNKQRSMAIAIKEAVEILQEEVLALEKRRQTLYWSVNICQAPMKVVLEYFRFFRIGMNTPLPLPSLSPTLSRTSTTSTSSTSINTKKHFLRVVMEQDLQYGFFRGVEFLIDQWIRYTSYFDALLFELDHVDGPFHLQTQLTLVKAHARLKVRLTKATLIHLFPHLFPKKQQQLQEEKEKEKETTIWEHMKRKLIGQMMEYSVQVLFFFNEQGKVQSLETQVDFLTPFLQLYQNDVFNISLLFHGALINPSAQLGIENEEKYYRTIKQQQQEKEKLHSDKKEMKQ